MSNTINRRLIEIYLPLEAISAQPTREKSINHGHISGLHFWWVWHSLAAVFAAL